MYCDSCLALYNIFLEMGFEKSLTNNIEVLIILFVITNEIYLNIFNPKSRYRWINRWTKSGGLHCLSKIKTVTFSN